jgi:hypothetical protein
MDKATLVDIDIKAGERVLEILDKAGFKVNVALWLYSSEFEAWRLHIASPLVDTEGPREAYVQLFSALRSSEPDLASAVTITLVSPKDSFMRSLRRIFGTTKSVHGMRLGGNIIDGMFVEQAYVYRIK